MRISYKNQVSFPTGRNDHKREALGFVQNSVTRNEVISNRLTVLVDRLRELETRTIQPHERPIVEVGMLALRDKICELGRQMKAC